jgi:Dynamin family
MIVCGKCGHDNPDGQEFCEECDAFLAWHGVAGGTPAAPRTRPAAPAPDPPAAPPPAPAPTAPARPAAPVPGTEPPPPPVSRARGPEGAAPPRAPTPAPRAPAAPAPGPATPSAHHAPAPAAPGVADVAGQKVAIELATCLAKAREQGRADLVDRLEAARRDLADNELAVVVAGEYKQGKSTLVNGIVQTEVCPVDDDVVTALPTIVRYGAEPTALVHVTPDEGDAPDGDESPPGDSPPEVDALGRGTAGTPISFADLTRYVRGELNGDGPGPPGNVRSVEVRIDRRVLRTGLTFVDSPGVGGLESAEGSIVLGVMALAEALIFVTDASQELTRAEISFLQAARARCSKIVCVVTKTDLHPEWRRIVELDRDHLASAGLDVPVVPVSSFLRMRAAATVDDAMNAESGYPALVEFLRSAVVAQGGAARAERVAAEVGFVAGELSRGWQAESEVMARPEQADALVERLSKAAAAAQALQSGGAPWQQVLSDGIQDLVADVDHDLRTRLQVVVRSGEEIIARSDPAESWGEFEVWLRRQVVTAAVATYDYLAQRATELTDRVGQQFQQDAASPIAFSITAPVAKLEGIALGGQFADRGVRSSAVLSAARGSYGGMVMFGMAGSLLGIPVAAPVMLLLSLGLGRRALREEKSRRHQQHQAEARGALHRYAQEVSMLVGKECKDALRRTQRLLRDEFAGRARSLHQTTTQALASAERARALDPATRASRQEEAAREIAQLGALGVAPEAQVAS